MGEIIDFSKYKEELESRSNSLSTFLKEKGADDELADYAAKRSKALVEHLSDLGQYSFPITLPSSLSTEEQQQVAGDIRAGIDQVRGKLEAVIRGLAVRALIAEVKVFQYERIHRKSF